MSAQPPGWCGGPDGGTPFEDYDDALRAGEEVLPCDASASMSGTEFVPDLVTVLPARNWRAIGAHPRPYPGFTVEKSLALENPCSGYDFDGLVTPSSLGQKDAKGEFFDPSFVNGPNHGITFLGSVAGSEATGIASPQLGMVSPWFIACDTFKTHVFRRPHIVKFYGKEEYGIEGCLSIPDEKFEVLRHTKVDIEYLDEDGELRKMLVKRNALLARVIQHEFDHLCGVLISRGHKV
jgi:hypothetical protein